MLSACCAWSARWRAEFWLLRLFAPCIRLPGQMPAWADASRLNARGWRLVLRGRTAAPGSRARSTSWISAHEHEPTGSPKRNLRGAAATPFLAGPGPAVRKSPAGGPGPASGRGRPRAARTPGRGGAPAGDACCSPFALCAPNCSACAAVALRPAGRRPRACAPACPDAPACAVLALRAPKPANARPAAKPAAAWLRALRAAAAADAAARLYRHARAGRAQARRGEFALGCPVHTAGFAGAAACACAWPAQIAGPACVSIRPI